MKTILNYLETTAEKFPDKTAVIDENGSCTYKELLENSRRVGSALTEIISPRTPVAVFMEKGIPALQAFLGTVLAGGFYSMQNPEFPENRLMQIQKVLAPAAILADMTTSFVCPVGCAAENITSTGIVETGCAASVIFMNMTV